MFRCQRLWWTACSCLAIVTLSGCVDGELRTLSRYDATNDSFVYLCTYTNVREESKEETDHMVSLWNRRESIVPLFAWFAAERRGPHGFSFFEIGDPKSSPEVQRLKTNLDSVQIAPGEFHLNEHGCLSWYTQIAVPGAAVDAVIDEKSQAISSLLQAYGEDLERKSSDRKIEKATWNKTRQDILKNMLRKATDPLPSQTDRVHEELPPFDAVSVKKFIRAGTDHSFKVVRSKDVVTCIFPLSQADCDEAVATVDVLKENIPLALERHMGQQDETSILLAAGVFSSIEVRHIVGTGLQVSIILSRLAPCLNRIVMEDYEPKPKEGHEIGFKTTVAAVAGRGIRINKQLSIRDKAAEFPVK